MDNIKPYKPRKSHRKSRNGCKNCRRRKIKCDETKPECRTCVIREEQCEYFPHTWQIYAPNNEQSATLSEEPVEISLSTPKLETRISASIDRDDMYLLDHYLEHASDPHGLNPAHAYARKVGLPKLASENEGLLCTLLAVGAACLALDLLQSDEAVSHLDQIEDLISKGDHYHAKALACLHSKLADGSQDLQIAHTHSAIVFGYSTARRRIFRLLYRQQQDLRIERQSQQLDVDIPSNLEWMHLLRGVQTIGRALSNANGTSQNPPQAPSGPSDPYVAAYVKQAIGTRPEPTNEELQHFAQTNVAPRHGLTLWISSTIKPALQTLHTDLDEFYKRFRIDHDMTNDASTVFASTHAEVEFEVLQALAACRSAVSALEALSSAVFQTITSSNPSSSSASPASSASSPSTSIHPTPSPFRPHDSTSRASDWRKTYLSPPSFSVSEPLTRGILTWVNRVSAPFVALLSTPLPYSKLTNTTSHPSSPPSSQKLPPDLEISLIAWNIYAHWAALTVLMEDECWWWADLGMVDVAHLELLLGPTILDGMQSSRDGTADGRPREWWPGVVRQASEAYGRGFC